jgi:uncharacterized protein
MFIDIHTHLWEKKHIINNKFFDEAKAVGITKNIIADYKKHFEKELKYVDKALVFGLNAKASGIKVPNEYISKYAKEYPEKVIGYASVDPNDSEASQELEYCVKELDLKGLKLGPIYQHFNPHDEKIAYPIYEKAQKLNVPIMWHMGTSFVREGLLENSRPYLIDRIAVDFPKLRMIIAHMGHPWESETIVVIRKQPNVYADAAALYYRPIQLCNTLALAFEYKVTHKILFGTDFPFTTVKESIEGLKKIKNNFKNEIFQEIPETIIDDIIYKNNLNFLQK